MHTTQLSPTSYNKTVSPPSTTGRNCEESQHHAKPLHDFQLPQSHQLPLLRLGGDARREDQMNQPPSILFKYTECSINGNRHFNSDQAIKHDCVRARSECVNGDGIKTSERKRRKRGAHFALILLSQLARPSPRPVSLHSWFQRRH